jgi:hypothetical protein
VTSKESVVAVVNTAASHFGGLDILRTTHLYRHPTCVWKTRPTRCLSGR